MTKIAAHIDKLLHSNEVDVCSLCWLNYLLSFFPCCDACILVNNIVFWSLCQLRKQLSDEKNVSVLVPLVRFFGNVCVASDDHTIALLNESDFTEIILQLLNFSYEPICKETLLLIANIINNPSTIIHSTVANVKFKESLEKSVVNVSALF